MERTEKLLEKLHELLLEKNYQGIQSIIDKIHAVDLANWIVDQDEDTIISLFGIIEYQQSAEILEKIDEEYQVKIMDLLSDSLTIEIFNFMSNDDIADILGNLSIGKSKRLLQLMKQSDSQILKKLMGYDEESAGGIMTTEYIALSEDMTIGQALNKIREIGPSTEVIEQIYVTDHVHKLIGVADIRNILAADSEEKLGSIMESNFISVYPEEDQEQVAHIVSKYDLIAIPVINRNGAMLGIITVDDIIDVMVEEQTEDILRMGGASAEEKIGGSVFLSLKKRLPWLLVNLVTAFLAAFTISAFEDVIAKVAALASAMTIISGMGGNAGTQTMSLVIRSITLGEIDIRRDWKLVSKEILLGLLDGAIVGIVTGLILFIRYGNIYLGLIVVIAMIGNLIIAGIFGFFIPLVIKAFGADPALSSSIFLTTATDVLGFFIFLGLATIFLPYLTT